jgi:hypothetical protein
MFSRGWSRPTDQQVDFFTITPISDAARGAFLSGVIGPDASAATGPRLDRLKFSTSRGVLVSRSPGAISRRVANVVEVF